jgi:hypothetical protein
MKTNTKTNYEETYSYASVLTPFLGYVNTRTLAFAMFVALTLLGTTRGNEPQTAELSQGLLEVYSATDEFNDGGSPYYAHSPYAIYALDGKLFKNVENHISRSDEIPETVSLPVGSYTVEARSEKGGYVRIPVRIKEGRRTVLALDR